MKTCLCILILTAASVVGACGYRTWQLLGDAREAVALGTNNMSAAVDIADKRTAQALALIREAVIKVDTQVSKAAGKLDAPLGELSYAIREFGTLPADARPVLNSVRRLAKQVDSAAPLFLDCDHNPDCVFNRFQGTSKAIERSAQNFGQMSTEVRLAVPPAIHSFQAIQGSVRDTSQSIALGFPKIVNNVGGVAENVNRLTRPRIWDQVIKGAVAGAVTYGSLK